MRPIALLFWLVLATTARADTLPLRDGDRIVIVGGAIVEREIFHNYFETLVTLLHPKKDIVFRNLGWSGDNVHGHSRTVFEPADTGFEKLKSQILAQKPTVGLIAYGMNESFAGLAGLEDFVLGLKRTADVFLQSGARIVFISPIRHENLGPPLPDPTEHNADLRLYVDAIRKVAEEGGYPFVNLFEISGDSIAVSDAQAWTENGLHPTAAGYWRLALATARGLGFVPPAWKIDLALDDGVSLSSEGFVLRGLNVKKESVRFQVKDLSLPLPLSPSKDEGNPIAENSAAEDSAARIPRRVLRIAGLAAGDYVLKIDGQEVVKADAGIWARGLTLSGGPDFEQTAELRRRIHRKNELFFHRWRPQNETYLLLFRKHEQGNNAKEIRMFDPLIAAEEKAIARLRRPPLREYSLERAKEVSK